MHGQALAFAREHAHQLPAAQHQDQQPQQLAFANHRLRIPDGQTALIHPTLDGMQRAWCGDGPAGRNSEPSVLPRRPSKESLQMDTS
jgi:hypothetical protein